MYLTAGWLAGFRRDFLKSGVHPPAVAVYLFIRQSQFFLRLKVFSDRYRIPTRYSHLPDGTKFDWLWGIATVQTLTNTVTALGK